MKKIWNILKMHSNPTLLEVSSSRWEEVADIWYFHISIHMSDMYFSHVGVWRTFKITKDHLDISMSIECESLNGKCKL